MMRLLTILICVFFLSGFGWFSKSIDCDALVNNVLFEEGGWFNADEKALQLRLKEMHRLMGRKWERYEYMKACKYMKKNIENGTPREEV